MNKWLDWIFAVAMVTNWRRRMYSDFTVYITHTIEWYMANRTVDNANDEYFYWNRTQTCTNTHKTHRIKPLPVSPLIKQQYNWNHTVLMLKVCIRCWNSCWFCLFVLWTNSPFLFFFFWKYTRHSIVYASQSNHHIWCNCICSIEWTTHFDHRHQQQQKYSHSTQTQAEPWHKSVSIFSL